MADVEISYNNETITSLSDSGTEVLETEGTFCTSDIVVSYTKSGGGGTSNVMSGTFTTGNTAGNIETLSVPYSGNGYPICVELFAVGGVNNVPSAPAAAVCQVGYIKMDATQAPTYTGVIGATNGVAYMYIRRTSGGAGTTGGSNSGGLFSASDPASTAANCTRMPNATTIKYYVQNENYGYAPNTTYRYVIVYSE